ncbi:sensor histidine kinase [Macrococcus sp. 18KM445]|uniref:sensor histidine kinase n=2 Tax=Macrococcus equi TaxID=3395462 RepID=UPI0039BDE0A4
MMHPKQGRLYLLFASSVFVLLVTFSIIAYVTTLSSINYQLKLKSDHILSSEFKEHFKQKQDGLHLLLNNDTEESSNQIYFITQDNAIIKQPDYDRQLIAQINTQLTDDKEFRHRYMNIDNAHYYVSGKKVQLANHEMVYMYTVFESTESYHGLSQLKNVLIGLTVIYIFLILLMTYFFSKKAMAPLEYAVTREKQFVQDASHELKTPLAVMKAGTEVIEQFDGDRLSDVGKEMIIDMKNEINHMTALIGDLLSLSRLDGNMAVEAVNLSEIVVERIHHFERQQVTVIADIKQNVIIKGNAQALKQALSILFENAVKYVEHPQIIIRLSEHELIFKDNGPGVAEKDLSHMFERFYRGNTTKEGSGIGLALFKEIMDQHQAKVHVSNDNGLTFKINFK